MSIFFFGKENLNDQTRNRSRCSSTSTQATRESMSSVKEWNGGEI